MKKIFDKYLIIFLCFLLLIILNKSNLFRNIYILFNQNLNARLIQVYGDCDKKYFGFLKYVKENYKFDYNPKIVDYKIQPDVSWIIYNTNKKIDNNVKILLGYPDQQELSFYKKNKLFISNNNIINTKGIKSIHLDVKNNIDLNKKIKIYKIKDKKKIIIYEKIINSLKKNDNIIEVNHKTNLINSRWENIYFEITNITDSEIKNINSIKLSLINKYIFKNEDIVYKRKNCYLIK